MILFEKIILKILSLSGFFIALYIYLHKNKKKPLVCPLKSNCEKVIHSDYSKFFGIPVEILGMIYYSLIFLISLGSFFFSNLIHPSIFSFALGLTILAFLFSLYLTFIQLFVLREMCTWCLTSALASTLIFIFSLSVYNYNLNQFLINNYKLILLLHAVSSAIGLGAATTADFLFIRFLKDFKISEKEKQTLDFISQLIWFSLGLIILSGIGIYLTRMEELHQSSKFLVKSIIVLIIVINGTFLNLLISPHLIKISFDLQNNNDKKEVNRITRMRKIAFALGAISIISWYSAFILGELSKVNLSFLAILGIYLIFLIVGIVLSQILEDRYFHLYLKNRYLISDKKEE